METSLKQFACYKEEREGQYLESDEGIFFFDAKDFNIFKERERLKIQEGERELIDQGS